VTPQVAGGPLSSTKVLNHPRNLFAIYL